MLKSVFLACLALCLFTVTLAAQCGRPVIEQNWNSYMGNYKPYGEKDALRDFPIGDKRPGSNGKEYRSGLIDVQKNNEGYLKGGAGTGDRVDAGEGNLRIKHPKGCVGTAECGAVFSVRLPEPLRSATMSFKVKFDKDYDFTRGGKLPGLCDEECPTGCVAKGLDGGWSGRVHFRPAGELTSYMYLPGGGEVCGKDVWWGQFMPANKWQEVRVYYSMNTPGKEDGEQKVWLDGKLVQHTTGILYDNTGGHGIERVKFDNFHGGKTDGFRPSKTQYVWIDDFMVQEGMCPPAGARIELPKSERDYYPDYPDRRAREDIPNKVFDNDDASDQCAGKYEQCHGFEKDQRRACCSPDLQCVQRESIYGQCRPKSQRIPDDWFGNILTYGAPPAAKPATPATTPPATPPATPKAAPPATTPEITPDNTPAPPVLAKGECSLSFKTCLKTQSCCNESDQCVEKDQYFAQCLPKGKPVPPESEGWSGRILTPNASPVPATPAASPPATPAVPPPVTKPDTGTPPATPAAMPPATPPVAPAANAQCTLTFKSCIKTRSCCDSSAQCVEKDDHYAQCMPKGKPARAGWTGRILTPNGNAPAPPSNPPVKTPAATPGTPPSNPPSSPPASSTPAKQCGLTFRPCGPGIGLCCNSSDQCVKKSEDYAQCRPKSRGIPDDPRWDGSIITSV